MTAVIDGHQQQVRALQSRLEVKQNEVARLERQLERMNSSIRSTDMSPAYTERRRMSTDRLDLQEQLNLMLLHRSTETEDLQMQLAEAQV